MKKKLLALVAVFIMSVCVGSVSAFAANLVFNGNAEDFVDLGGSTDLFADFKNMEPGSSATQTITLINQSEKTMRYYLRAEILEALGGDGGAYELTIVNGDESIFDGVMGGVDTFGKAKEEGSDYLGADFLLATLKENEQTDVTFTIAIDGDGFGNEYQGTEGAYRFVFSVEDANTPIETVSRDTSKEVVVVEKVVQKTVVSGTTGGGTQTGDNNAVVIFIIVGAVALLGVILLLVWKKKKDSSED